MRSWLKDIPNTTIISVDYRLRSEYPFALQDVFDAYFWLTSGSEQVRQVLGFKPTKVVVGGDSAGANLVYTLSLLLTDMRDYASKHNCPPPPPLPHALVSVYGFYTFSSPSPIMINSFLDLLLPPTIIRIAFGSMVEGCDEPAWNSKHLLQTPQFHPISSLSLSFHRAFLHAKEHMWLHCCLPSKDNWYDMNSDPATANRKMFALIRNIYYLNTLDVYDFKRIRIPIFLITSEFDICLDQNIELARKWKGNYDDGAESQSNSNLFRFRFFLPFHKPKAKVHLTCWKTCLTAFCSSISWKNCATKRTIWSPNVSKKRSHPNLEHRFVFPFNLC
jgi:acetyl esterase/lipase